MSKSAEARLPSARRPGDPIPPSLVREFRTKNHLTQEQLAERLGVQGGKPVISGWETGRSRCEGPAAELLLHLLGRGNASFDAATLFEEVDKEWRRAGDSVTSWRQILVVPESPVTIDTQDFVKLFPNAALSPADQVVPHGFPFVVVSNFRVFGIGESGWLGTIPSDRSAQPLHLWLLKRDGRFAFRQVTRDETLGHLDVGMLAQLAVQTTHFLRKLAPQCKLDKALGLTLRLDLEGTRGRGLIDAEGDTELGAQETTRWSENHASASVSTTVAALEKNPMSEGLRVVVELASQINPQLANADRLRQLVKARARVSPPLQFLRAI